MQKNFILLSNFDKIKVSRGNFYFISGKPCRKVGTIKAVNSTELK